MIVQLLQTLAALGTLLTGLISVIQPHGVQGFTGLTVTGPRGTTEIRAILGGTFIGLGIAPLLLRTASAYQMLGITYLVIAAIRAIFILIDKSAERSNLISFAVECVFGIILML